MSFESSLDILGTHHLSDKYFGYIFSQFITCLFILLTLSFEYQRFIILITNLTVFCDSYFLCPIQESLPNPKSQKFSSVFSYRSFIVLILYVGIWSILNWFFLICCKVWGEVHCVYISSSCFSTICWKRYALYIELLDTCVKNQSTMNETLEKSIDHELDTFEKGELYIAYNQ